MLKNTGKFIVMWWNGSAVEMDGVLVLKKS